MNNKERIIEMRLVRGLIGHHAYKGSMTQVLEAEIVLEAEVQNLYREDYNSIPPLGPEPSKDWWLCYARCKLTGLCNLGLCLLPRVEATLLLIYHYHPSFCNMSSSCEIKDNIATLRA
jgi:hypothetical protein